MDMSGARARLLRSVLALLVAALALLALCSCAPAMREEGSADSVPEEPFTVVAEGLSTNPGDALENSTYLQLMMNRLSRGGGGVVIIPEGVYRFAATSTHSLGDFAIKACDNVKVVGAGEGKTVLKPVGRWSETGRFEHGVDMFAYTGMRSGEYLVNADFEDFTIDGSEAQGSPDGYNASGKGFFFKLFRDCDWRNVTVKNTDGTGFGMDFPINCTMADCTAIGCGKNAGEDDEGASGFGIGTGFSGLESMVIEECESYDNAKFGFFFEHQTRFNARVEALSAVGFAVSDCVASGNLHNFGGMRAHDVTYERCVSEVSGSRVREAYTQRAFNFESHSYRTQVVDCRVEQKYSDVIESDDCFEAIQWALDGALLESSPDEEGLRLFRPDERMLRSEAVVLLWRYAGRPGNVVFDGLPEMPDDYEDVAEADYYVDAALWMGSLRDAALAEFRGKDYVTNAELVTMIWRMAGRPQVELAPGFVDIDKGSYYAQALAWAVRQGFVKGDGLEFGPFRECSRAEVVMLLKAFDESLSAGLAGAVPREVDMLSMQKRYELLGSTVMPRASYVLDDFEECAS